MDLKTEEKSYLSYNDRNEYYQNLIVFWLILISLNVLIFIFAEDFIFFKAKHIIILILVNCPLVLILSNIYKNFHRCIEEIKFCKNGIYGIFLKRNKKINVSWSNIKFYSLKTKSFENSRNNLIFWYCNMVLYLNNGKKIRFEKIQNSLSLEILKNVIDEISVIMIKNGINNIEYFLNSSIYSTEDNTFIINFGERNLNKTLMLFIECLLIGGMILFAILSKNDLNNLFPTLLLAIFSILGLIGFIYALRVNFDKIIFSTEKIDFFDDKQNNFTKSINKNDLKTLKIRCSTFILGSGEDSHPIIRYNLFLIIKYKTGKTIYTPRIKEVINKFELKMYTEKIKEFSNQFYKLEPEISFLLKLYLK